MITDHQVKLLRQKMKQGHTQEAAAAAAGMSERSARKFQSGPLPSQRRKPRTWRTRQDPFDGAFDEHIVPLLRNDHDRELKAPVLFELLQQRCDGRFKPGQIRSLQRRIRQWRALHGSDQHVIFPQDHKPGREAAIDFSHANSLNVTIAGQPFEHMFFTFRLAFSAWIWFQIAFSETFEALVSGLQGGLFALGGVPEVVRHDNLSAATHELKRMRGRQLNKRFKDVLDHFGLESTRINPGQSNENGGVEKGHHIVKSTLNQALIIRGHRDFSCRDNYLRWARDIIEDRCNRPRAEAIAHEKEHLKALPPSRVPEYTTHRVKVRSWSTINLGGRHYSLPSRLIGHEVEARQYPDHVEAYFADCLVATMPRLRGNQKVLVNYRHIIWSLVRKPGAFRRYKWQEALFPTLTFRRAYDALLKWRGDRADIEYVRILHLAASTLQSQVEHALRQLLDGGERFEYIDVKVMADPEPQVVPEIHVRSPDLSVYDSLLHTPSAQACGGQS